MKKDFIPIYSLYIVAAIAIFTAVAHMSCIVIGESCYRAQLAPEPIITSAITGSLFAPVATIIISALFLVCAAYALSAANLISKLPLLKSASYCISTLCLLRGIATVPLSFIYPEMVSTFTTVAGIIWFISGVLFLYGFQFVKVKAE